MTAGEESAGILLFRRWVDRKGVYYHGLTWLDGAGRKKGLGPNVIKSSFHVLIFSGSRLAHFILDCYQVSAALPSLQV